MQTSQTKQTKHETQRNDTTKQNPPENQNLKNYELIIIMTGSGLIVHCSVLLQGMLGSCGHTTRLTCDCKVSAVNCNEKVPHKN